MKQLLILSGKGGTGKTTIASAFIRLSEAKAYADCDVDAPNLHLITNQDSEQIKNDYYGMQKAEIDTKLCTCCDNCRQVCRFGAIEAGEGYRVDSFVCEGCGVCQLVCPVDAISLEPAVAGELMLYKSNGTVFSTAKLKMGSGTSGMLITEVKKQMKTSAKNAELAIIDGSPGIGCPVIASISGVDMVLVVAEPSISGINDMERILATAAKFNTKTFVCINKYDTNLSNSEKIEKYCRDRNISFVGRIPYDPCAVKAINDAKTIVDIECAAGKEVKKIYNYIIKIIQNEKETVV